MTDQLPRFATLCVSDPIQLPSNSSLYTPPIPKEGGEVRMESTMQCVWYRRIFTNPSSCPVPTVYYVSPTSWLRAMWEQGTRTRVVGST